MARAGIAGNERFPIRPRDRQIKKRPMKTVTAEYAAEHLEDLLELVAAGETVVLSIDGRPAARLVPVDDNEGPEVPSSEVEEAFYGD